MTKSEYNQMIATNASIIWAGLVARDNSYPTSEDAIKVSERIAELCGIEEPDEGCQLCDVHDNCAEHSD